MFSLFKKKSQVEINSYGNSSVYLSSDIEPDFEINFLEELSDGTLVFDIVDSDFDKAGHVISPAKATDREEIQIIKSTFYDAFTLAKSI